MTVTDTMRFARPIAKSLLLIGAAQLALLAGAGSALAQDQDDRKRSSNLFKHAWQIDSQVVYTDNYRRLPDSLTRTNFSRDVPVGIDPITNFPIFVNLPSDGDLVAIETPNNIIATATVSGSTIMRRKSFSGLLSGSLEVGKYLNDDSLENRIASSAVPGQPLTDFFTVPGVADQQEFDVSRSSFGLPDRDEVFVKPNISVAGTARVVDNLFYVDVGGLAQQVSAGGGSSLAQEGVGQSGNDVTYGGVSISPYLFRQFTDESTLEVRFRATAVEVLSEQIDTSGFRGLSDEDIVALENGQFENDSLSTEFLAEFTSGALFDRLSFQLGAFHRQVKEDGSDVSSVDEVDFGQSSASLDVALGVNKTLSLTGGVGYDEINFADLDPVTQAQIDAQADQDSQEDRLSGTFWRVGFIYAPSRRSKLKVSVGERFGGTALEVDGTYRPTQRLRFGVGVTRALDTGLQNFANSALQLQSQAFSALTSLSDGQNATAATILDRALSFEGSGFRDVQRGRFGVAAFNSARASVQGNFRRTSLGATLQFSDADNEFRNSTLVTTDLTAQRQVSRRFSINARARFSRDEGILVLPTTLVIDPNAPENSGFTTDERLYSIGTSYQIGKQLALTSRVYRVERETDGVSTGTQFDYTENAAALGLRWLF